MNSILEQLQLDIGARLESLPEFQYITVAVVRPRSQGEATQIISKLDGTLAGSVFKNGRCGAAVLINMPETDVPNPDIPGPYLILSVKVRVIENPLFNMGAAGSQISAEQISLNILHALHQWDTGSSGSPLYIDQKASEPVTDYPEKIAYDCIVKTRHGLDPAIKTSVPIVTQNSALPAASVTISGEPGALLYYTVDGSLPWPGNPTATLYSGSFVQAEAVTIRAAAYKAGMQGSDITQIEIKS